MAEISGVWRFNKTLKQSSADIGSSGWYSFIFYSAGVQYTSMRVPDFNDGSSSILYGRTEELKVYDFDTKEWTSEKYRIIDFWVKQNVSDQFKYWLENNAEQLTTKTIKGTWFMNATIKTPDTVFGGNKLISESIKFSCGSANFAMTNDYLSLYYDDSKSGSYALYFGEDKVYDHKTSAWTDGALRKIDFGEEEQTVSKDFYDWFTSNATEWNCTRIQGVREDGKQLYLSPDEGILLNCAGKVFKNDITVIGTASAIMCACEEKDDRFAFVSSPSDRFVLKVKGTKAFSKYLILADKCISFYIKSTNNGWHYGFLAKDGMTWLEWKNSALGKVCWYGEHDTFFQINAYWYNGEKFGIATFYDFEGVVKNDVIISGNVYEQNLSNGAASN